MRQTSLFDDPPRSPKPARVPFAAGSDTSKAAAESIGLQAPTQRRRVFEFIRETGEHGATDDEGETSLGMRPQSYTPRRGELARAALIRDSGMRRPTASEHAAAVWVTTGKLFDEAYP
jgi:hypothetical protein